MPSFYRRILDLAWFSGPIHRPKPGGHYAAWRDAIANCLEFIRTDILSLSYMRDPSRTPRLMDLQTEFGVTDDVNLTDAVKIDLLNTKRYRKDTNATDDDLQTLLDKGGFNLTVYNNSPTGPAIDPALIMDQNFQLQALGGTNYYAGNDDAYAGRSGGIVLANGDTFNQTSGFVGVGWPLYAGNTIANAGYFTGLVRSLVIYPLPPLAINWPFFFFVGGDATFAADGSILTIAQGQVPTEQRNRLEEIILGFKPLFTWCGMVITFT